MKSDWQYKRLGELVTFTSGGTPSKSKPHFWNGNIPWISAKTMREERVSSSDLFITEEGLQAGSKLAPKGSILLLTRGSGLFNGIPICLVENEVAFNQDVKCLNSCSEVENKFIFYWLISQKKYLSAKVGVTGIGAGKFDTDFLTNLIVPIPPKEEREQIVALAEALSQRIETNKKINEIIYHLLKLSFKHDYLEIANSQNQWLTITLDDATSNFGTGLNPRKNFVLGHGNNYYVTIKNMGQNRIYLDSRCDMIDDEALTKIQKRSNLQPGDLLFSGIGTIGRVYLIDKPAVNWNTSESIFNIRPNELVSSEFLYLLLLSDDMQDYAISLSSGSVQKGIRMADLKRYTFILPPNEVMSRLTAQWSPLIQEIKCKELENDQLILLRDILLPKIMIGEISLKNKNEAEILD